MNGKAGILYGLPENVIFCKRCVMSNQRPSSYPEFKHKKDRITPTLHIDEEGVCDACRYAERKIDIRRSFIRRINGNDIGNRHQKFRSAAGIQRSYAEFIVEEVILVQQADFIVVAA